MTVGVTAIDSTKGIAEVFCVSRSHQKTTLFRWRALSNPGWIYAALPKDAPWQCNWH
jgi:hypothetical protein